MSSLPAVSSPQRLPLSSLACAAAVWVEGTRPGIEDELTEKEASTGEWSHTSTVEPFELPVPSLPSLVALVGFVVPISAVSLVLSLAGGASLVLSIAMVGGNRVTTDNAVWGSGVADWTGN